MKLPDGSGETLKSSGIFTIRGLRVGRITNTSEVTATRSWSDNEAAKGWDQVKLFWYEPATYSDGRDTIFLSGSGAVTESMISTATFENTSWGRCKAEPRDIIVIAAGSNIPLVLRKEEDRFLFAGDCWLVSSQIDVTKPKRDCGRLEGFSEVMYGSIVDEIGKTCVVEEFELCEGFRSLATYEKAFLAVSE